MEDRYIELKQLLKRDPNAKDIELGEIQVEKSGSFMKDSNDCIQAVRLCLGTVKDSNGKLLELRERFNRITTDEEEKSIRNRLNKSMELNQNLFDKAKKLIDNMENTLKKLEKDEPDEPETRNLRLQCNALVGQFKELLLESHGVQNEVRGKLKDKIVRQVKVLDSEISEEKAEEIAENPKAFQELVMGRTFGEPHMRLRNVVMDIELKYNDILELERSVKHILSLLQEIGLLVNEQGEYIDTIEAQVSKANNYVERAAKHLDKAKKDHQAKRKRMCCILCCCLILLAVILGGVAAKLL